MPNGRVLYDSIRDCLDCSRLHIRSALYDGIIYIRIKFNCKSNVPYFTRLLVRGRSVKEQFSACIFLFVCVCYCLLGSLVAMRDHGLLFWLCVLTGLMQLHVWSCALAESLKNSSCIILVEYSTVMSVCPSHATQWHMTHSATCNIVWVCQDSPIRCPVGVPGIVDQP